MFPCRQHRNLYGNNTFPLASQSMNSEIFSGLQFLFKFKSLQIIRNIEINNLSFSKEINDGNLRTNFPVKNKNIRNKNFPTETEKKFVISSNSKLILPNLCNNSSIENNAQITEIESEFKSPQFDTVNNNKQSLKFPLHIKPENGKFLYESYKKPKAESRKILNQPKLQILSHKTDLYLYHFKNLIDINGLTKFPITKTETSENYTIFPLKTISYSTNGLKLITRNNQQSKFPCKLKQNKESFPSEIMKLNFKEFKGKYKIFQIKNTLPDFRIVCTRKNETTLTKFPLENVGKNKMYKNFPLHLKKDVDNIRASFFIKHTNSIEDFKQFEKLKEQQIPTHTVDGKTWNIINNCKTSRTQTTSRSMTHNLHKQYCQKFEKNYKEHAAQVHVENPASPSPSTVATENDDLRILPAINSKNNPQSLQMAHYTENIEHNNDVIIISNASDCTPQLFEKEINSSTTNHKNVFEYFGSADGATDFALTPPMSVTSVQNTERAGSETNLDNHHNIHDLSDLCNPQVGQIVECSDVRDTLDKTVVYGDANLNSSRTGSFLVKNQEQISPAPPSPLTIKSDTSLLNYATSEISPNYYVQEFCETFESNWPEIDQIKTTINNHIQIKKEKEDQRSQIFYPETPTILRANVLSEKVNDMTVTRLADDERDGEELIEVLEHSKNILIDDLKIDEMKFEMKSVKGALPSTASGRTLGKYDDSITATNSLNNSANNRSRPLRSSINSAAATTRNLNNDNKNMPSLNSLRTNSSSPLNSNSNRVSLNDFRNSNDNIISKRTSLNPLRNSNSTSILSVDLPRYTPATDSLSLLRPNLPVIDRASSTESSLTVLPERTRLRRQRRLRTQDSQDEPEDPIERLKLLKARISASLSEVKGVLKQYSTEENANENPVTNVATPLSSLKENKDEEKKEEGPITFRFVKKVRRRSFFNEEEEGKANEALDNKDETDKTSIDKYGKIELEHSSLTTLPSHNTNEISRAKQEETEIEINKIINNLQSKTDEIQNIPKRLATRDVTPYPNKSENTEVKAEKVSDIKQADIRINQEVLKETTILEKRDKSPKPKIAISNKEIAEEEPTDKQQTDIDRNACSHKVEIPHPLDETKGATPKQPKIVEQETPNEVNLKTKKKINVKNKDRNRRSSLAAVEASKIEPPVKVAIPAQIQRRPSDSETVIKKKLITVKTTTSGIVEEVTPKPKILKVKRSLQKKSTETNNTGNAELATTQINNNSDEQHVKPTDVGSQHYKSKHNDKNKDALMPNAKTLDQNMKLLPTQLEIDENASLNEKPNDNLLLPQQLQQHQKATNKSTTTKLQSNELNRGIGDSGAMLEILTTVVSSKRTSEANGQKKPPEDFHDFLQQETTIVKPSQLNRNVLKESQTEANKIIDNKISLTELEARSTLTTPSTLSTIPPPPPPTPAAENFNNKLEEFTKQQQQVVESINELIVKKDEHVNLIKTNDENHQQPSLTTAAEDPAVTGATTKTISSPQISTSTTQDITEKTTTSTVDQKSYTNQIEMPELKLTPAPVQTAGPDSQHHKKKSIIKKIIRQTSIEKAKKSKEISQKPEDKIAIPPEDTAAIETVTEDNTEELSESTEISEISESSVSLPTEEGEEEVAAAIVLPKKERKIKKKVIIKRQKRRLSIGDTFFNHAEVEEPQISEVETLEKPVAYFSDEEVDQQEEDAKQLANESEEEKKPLKSCIMLKQYQIGDEVLFAERFKKTQVKWRRGRITERITSISYMIDIDGKEISSHINYLKKYTGRKVNFGNKEYLEIDYEQLAEDEEKAEKLQRRSYSIWNMVKY